MSNQLEIYKSIKVFLIKFCGTNKPNCSCSRIETLEKGVKYV